MSVNKQIVQKSKEILEGLGNTISTGHLYELFSQLSGHKSWNVAKAQGVSFEGVIPKEENLNKGDGNCSHVLDKLEMVAKSGLSPYYHTHEEFLVGLTMDLPWDEKGREMAEKWLYGPGDERLKKISDAIQANGGPSYYEAFKYTHVKNGGELPENLDPRWKKEINPVALVKIFGGEWVYASELTPEILKTLEDFVGNAYTCEKQDILESHLLHGEDLNQGIGSWPLVSLEKGKIVLESCYGSKEESKLIVNRFKLKLIQNEVKEEVITFIFKELFNHLKGS